MMKPTKPTTQSTAARKALRRVSLPPRPTNSAADAVAEHIEAAIADATGRTIDFDAFEAEFDANGALSEQSYALLASAGLPRSIVDRHIEGRLAAHEKYEKEILDLVGGKARYARMTDWARRALTPGAFERYEASLRGEPKVVKRVIADMSAVYAETTGDFAGAAEPSAASGVTTAASDRRPAADPAARASSEAAAMRPVQRFTSAEQLAKAIRDPRYRSDPAYRAWVAETLAQSDVFGRKANGSADADETRRVVKG